MRTLLIIAGILAIATIAGAAGIGQNIGGGISQFDNGILWGGNGGFVPPVNPCTGTIDGSEGCPLPMLGI